MLANERWGGKFEWPLNYILSASMMQKYQCISDFLGLIHGTKKFLQSAQLEMFKRARSLKQNPNRIKIAMGHKCLALVTLLDQYAQTAVISFLVKGNDDSLGH